MFCLGLAEILLTASARIILHNPEEIVILTHTHTHTHTQTNTPYFCI